MKNVMLLLCAVATAMAAACSSPREAFVPLPDASSSGALDTGADTLATCSTSAECGSGYCSGGFCCNSECTGSCVSCALPGSEGTCTPQPLGVACGAASCTSGLLTLAATCDGQGMCAPPVVQDCAPFTCGGEACTTQCTIKDECAPNSNCVEGKCIGPKPLVISALPAEGPLAQDATFEVRFNKRMDQAATLAAISFFPALAVDAVWDARGSTLTLTPKSPLAPLPSTVDGNLALTVNVTAKDAEGQTLEAAQTFKFKRLRRFENQACALLDVVSVSGGYRGGYKTPNELSVGSYGTNVAGRTVESRAFVKFDCSGVVPPMVYELLSARAAFKVKTEGSPASPLVVVKGIAPQAAYTSESYSAAATTPDFTLNAATPATWTVDLAEVVKLREVRTATYTFRAETATSPSITTFDGYDLLELGAPQMLLNFVAY